MKDLNTTAKAKADALLAAARRDRPRAWSVQCRLHPQLKQMEHRARSDLLARADLEARSSARIVWLMLVVAAIGCGSALLLPPTLGPTLVGLTFALSLIGAAVAHQVNLFVATRHELSRFNALKLAERSEA